MSLICFSVAAPVYVLNPLDVELLQRVASAPCELSVIERASSVEIRTSSFIPPGYGAATKRDGTFIELVKLYETLDSSEGSE